MGAAHNKRRAGSSGLFKPCGAGLAVAPGDGPGEVVDVGIGIEITKTGHGSTAIASLIVGNDRLRVVRLSRLGVNEIVGDRQVGSKERAITGVRADSRTVEFEQHTVAQSDGNVSDNRLAKKNAKELGVALGAGRHEKLAQADI